MSRVRVGGWSWLFNSSKYHYFHEGRSLCGRWMILGGGDFGHPHEDEKCKECRRRRAKMVRREKKILVLCQGGQVRSVTIAGILKYDFGFDALAGSLEKNTPETLTMLCEWADQIIVVEDKLLEQMKIEYTKHMHKTRLFPLGPDVWRMSRHPELIDRIYALKLDEFMDL